MVTRNRVGTQSVGTVATTSNNNPQDPSKDNRVPAAPATLTHTEVLAYSAGTYSATVSLTWVMPTKATDGTTMTPDHTEIYRLAGSAAGTFTLATNVDAPAHTADLHGHAVGSVWQYKVRAVSANNKKSAFSNTVTITMPVTAPVQPQPSPPDTSSVGTLAQVYWDGKDQSGLAMPPDFDHIGVKRADDTNFTVNVTQMGTLLAAGTHIDGPYDINDVYYYRFYAVNRMGLAGPDSISRPVVIAGVDGSDVQPGTIDTVQLHDQLASDIQKAISSTTANAVPGNRIFGPSATRPTGSTSDPLLAGDLWFDSGNQTRPWRYGGSDTGPPNHGWVDVRDSITQAAFSNINGTLATAYILPDVVRTQLIHATTVDADYILAKDIIATGSINSAEGLFGVVDGAVINAGFISADRIAANSITADKMLIADITNFCNEPVFDNSGKAWIDPQAPAPEGGGANATLPLTVAASGGVPTMNADGVTINYNDGFVYGATGTGATYTIANTRTLDVTEIDQFYGELWVRRTTSATTGKVTLALNVTCGPSNTVVTKPIASYTFRTSDPVNTWFLITGFIQPAPPPKPAPTKQGGPGVPVWDPQCLPDGAYKAQPVILMDSTVAAGYKVQFTGARVQRKNKSRLVVDGSITAASIASQSITGAEIHAGTITADNIVTNTITATEIFSSGISGTSASISFITALLLRGETISTVGWDTDHMRPKWPGVTIDKNSMIYNDIDGHSMFELNFGNGSITFNSSVPNKNLARYEIDTFGIRLFPAGAAAVPSVNLKTADGSATFTGAITTGGTITGATVQTSNADPRVEMVTVAPVTGNSGYEEFAMTTAAHGVYVMFRTPITTPATPARILLDTFPSQPAASTVPRFLLDSDIGLVFYKNAKTIVFKLDADTGAVTLAGPILSSATITASTFQSAATGNSRLVMSPTAFSMTDDQGKSVILFQPGTSSVDSRVIIDTGADSFPRFYLDSTLGLRWYRSASDVAFAFNMVSYAGDPAGSLVLDGAIVTTGSITGSAIQTGTTGARITMDPTNGLRAYKANGVITFYANMAGAAYFSGTVSASDINTPKLNGGSIAGVTFGSGNSGGSFASPTLNTPTLGGTSTNTGPFTGSGGGSIVSGTGSARIVLVGSQIQIFGNNAIQGLIEEYSGGNDMVIEGYGAYGSVWLGYNQFYGGGQFQVYNGNGSSAKPLIYGWALQNTQVTTISAYAPVYVGTSGAAVMAIYTSSVRYKKAVRPLALDPRFMDIETATWGDKPNQLTVESRVSNPGLARRNTGFTAENLHRTGMTDLVVYDQHRRPQAIQQPAILAHTVAYVQHLVRQVQDLTARVAALEGSR